MYKQKFVTVLIRPVIETGATKEVNQLTTTATQMPSWRKRLFEEKNRGLKNFLSVK
jgi:hypothetical protein